MRTLNIAATGMLAQQLNVDVISNNIANMNTTGFKRQRAEFQDLLYQSVLRVGSSTSGQDTRAPSGIQIGAGVRRSEEHTSELQSLMRTSYAVFCLKKKTKKNNKI